MLVRDGVTRRVAAILVASLGFIGVAMANGDLSLQACYAANDKGDYAAAIEACNRAIQSGELSKNDSALAFNDLGNAYNRSGDYDHAIASYGEAIQRNPDFADAYFDRGTAYDFTDQYQLAVKDYSKAIKLRPDDANAYLYRGNARSLSGDYANAVRDYDTAAEMAPTFSDVAVWSKGVALFSLGKFADAEAAFQLYLKRSPYYSFGALWLYLAEAHAGKDGMPAFADRVTTLDPNQWPAPILQFYLGKATRDDVLAAAKIGDSTYLDQQACEAAFYLGEFYLLSGKTKNAHRDLTQAATTCPKSSAERGAAQTELDRK